MKKILTTLLIAAASAGFAQVGISENVDFTPNTNVEGNIETDANTTVMLDVDGQERVRSMPIAQPNNYSPVVRNNTTGVLEILTNSDNTSKPFNYVTYRIENPDQDWVSNLNTQIPTDRYSLGVIGYRFFNAGESGFINMSKQSIANSANQNQSEIQNNLPEITFTAAADVYAFKQNNTWRLYADYAGGGSKYWANAYWEIDVLIIDNAFVNVLNQVTTPLSGSATGTAAIPSGLGL